jgi:PLP dependent protein
MNDLVALISDNVRAVQVRIARAAERAGRDPASIRLVAVTKYVGTLAARALIQAGCQDLGESRPQELWEKATALRDLPVRWHLVGHLQRNKVRRSLPVLHRLHSADSLRLLTEIDHAAADTQSTACRVLLEVNVSGDQAKHGLLPHELRGLLGQLADLQHVRVDGLMTMAALDRPGDAARIDFRKLRELQQECAPHCPDNVRLDELSMGMSGDFEQAIEEGATIVRVGSALFAGLDDA